MTMTSQNEAEATYAPKLLAAVGCLEWSRGARDLWNLVRGLAPQPGTYTFFRGLLIRVLAARPLPGHPGQLPEGSGGAGGDRGRDSPAHHAAARSEAGDDGRGIYPRLSC
jgi:methionyl-tRNA formyltransferase